jgi:hypothetical protein
LFIQDTRDFDREQIDFAFTPDGAEITWASLMDGPGMLRVKGVFQ